MEPYRGNTMDLMSSMYKFVVFCSSQFERRLNEEPDLASKASDAAYKFMSEVDDPIIIGLAAYSILITMGRELTGLIEEELGRRGVDWQKGFSDN